MKTTDAAKAARSAEAAKPVLDRATFETEYPILFAEVLESGRALGFEQGKVEGWTEGAQHERARIEAVKAVLLPGHEGLIERLMFNGTTTGPEAAALVIKAENEKRELHLQAIAADAPKPVAHAVAPDPGPTHDAALPLEERCRRNWDRSAELRAEFGDNYDAYLAFMRAEEKGSVKILRRA